MSYKRRQIYINCQNDKDKKTQDFVVLGYLSIAKSGHNIISNWEFDSNILVPKPKFETSP